MLGGERRFRGAGPLESLESGEVRALQAGPAGRCRLRCMGSARRRRRVSGLPDDARSRRTRPAGQADRELIDAGGGSHLEPLIGGTLTAKDKNAKKSMEKKPAQKTLKETRRDKKAKK